MSQDFNIFDNTKPQSGEFFKFKSVGDAIQGTYIDVRNGTDSFGNQQTIYVLQDKEGKVWNLGFRQTAMVIHERMNGIRFGQIVGFKFDEERDSKKNPGTKVKIIRIYADPKFVDQEYLAHQKNIEQNYTRPSADAGAPSTTADEDFDNWGKDDVPFESPSDAGASTVSAPVSPEKPRNEAIDAIRTLAKTKGLTNDTMSEADADAVIEKYTELPLTEENLTKIIIKLTGYVSK